MRPTRLHHLVSSPALRGNGGLQVLSLRPLRTTWVRRVAMWAAAALCLASGASAAFAQSDSTSTLTGGASSGQVSSIDSGTEAPGNFYMPGMPVPKGEEGAAEAGAEGGKTGAGGRIGSVKMVERGALPQDQGLDRNTVAVSDLYRGIVPGIKDWHVFAKRARDAARKNPRKGNRLTWLGYQPTDRGSSLFVQTIKPVVFNVADGSDKEGRPTVEVTLIATRVPIYNNRRSLDTSYFPSAIVGARARPSGRSTVVTITLQHAVPYTVRQEAEFLFIDFDDAGTTPMADTLPPAAAPAKR